MAFSSRERNRSNNIYVLGKDFIQGVTTVGPTVTTVNKTPRTTIYAEKVYKSNLTEPHKKFVLSLHYNGDDSYLFVNGDKESKFRVKTFDNVMKQNILYLGNLSSDWNLTISTKTGLYESVYDFAVDYDPVNSVGTIYDIRRHLMKKHNI